MSNVDHVQVSCCAKGCHAVITFHRQTYNQLVESHRMFFCPEGHQQHFSGKSETQRQIESLEALNRRFIRNANRDFAIREELTGALKTCPFGCGYRARRHAQDGSEWSYAQMVSRVQEDMRCHLIAEHHALVAESVEASA